MMTELKEKLIKQAKDQYNDISPAGSRQDLYECFTIYGNQLYFWFNVDKNTKLIGCSLDENSRN